MIIERLKQTKEDILNYKELAGYLAEYIINGLVMNQEARLNINLLDEILGNDMSDITLDEVNTILSRNKAFKVRSIEYSRYTDYRIDWVK